MDLVFQVVRVWKEPAKTKGLYIYKTKNYCPVSFLIVE